MKGIVVSLFFLANYEVFSRQKMTKKSPVNDGDEQFNPSTFDFSNWKFVEWSP